MECQRQSIAEKLVPYIEGALADVDRREVHEHLQECQMCNQEFRSLKDVVSCLRTRVGHTLHYLPAISLSPDDVVDYALDAGRLSETTRRRIQLQLVESLDCQQEVEWLRELEGDLDRVEAISPPPFPAALGKALDATYGAEGRKTASVFKLDFAKADFLKRVQPRYLAAGLAGLLFTGMAAHSMFGGPTPATIATTAGSGAAAAKSPEANLPAAAAPAASPTASASALPVAGKDEVALLPEKVHPDDLPRLSRLLWDKKVAHSYRDGQIYVAGEDVEMAWGALRMNEGRQVAAAELKAGKLAKNGDKESIVAIGQAGKSLDEKSATTQGSLMDKLDAKLKGNKPTTEVAKQSKVETFKKGDNDGASADKTPVTWGNRYATPGKPDSTTESRPTRVEYGPSGSSSSAKPAGSPAYSYSQGRGSVNPPSQQASTQFRQSTVASGGEGHAKPTTALPASKAAEPARKVVAAEPAPKQQHSDPKPTASHHETAAPRREVEKRAEPKAPVRDSQVAINTQNVRTRSSSDLANSAPKDERHVDNSKTEAKSAASSQPKAQPAAKPAAPKVAVAKPQEQKPVQRNPEPRDVDVAPRPSEVALEHTNNGPVSNVQSAKVTSKPAKVPQPPAQVAVRTQEPVAPPAPKPQVAVAPVPPPAPVVNKPVPAPVVTRPAPPVVVATAPHMDDLKSRPAPVTEESNVDEGDTKKRKDSEPPAPTGMKTVPRWSDRQAGTDAAAPQAQASSAPVPKPNSNRVVVVGGISASDSGFVKTPGGGASRSSTPNTGTVSAGAVPLPNTNKSVPPKDPGDLILFKQAQKIVADMQLDAELKFERRDDNSLMITVKPQRALNQLETEQLRKALRKKLKLDDTDSVVIRQP